MPRARVRPTPRSTLLSHEAVVRYLLRRNILRSAEAVRGEAAVKKLSRRNHGYAVIRDNGDSYLIKQGIDSGRISTVRHESLVYDTLRQEACELAPFLVRSYGYDSRMSVLVIEFLKNGETLTSYCARRRTIPRTIGAEMGKALAILHMANWSARTLHSRLATDRLPWALFLAEPVAEYLWNSSAGVIELLKLVQRFGEFRPHLQRIRKGWEAKTVIHGDVRWENCILVPLSGGNGDVRLKIVDWEMAKVGDPLWDIGAVFSSFLSFWINGIPIIGDGPPDKYVEAAEVPLVRLQPSMRAFWRSYKHQVAITGGASLEFLLKATEYAAVHLLQTALEQVAEAVAVPGGVICLLQVSLNMMRDPGRAATDLLGIA